TRTLASPQRTMQSTNDTPSQARARPRSRTPPFHNATIPVGRPKAHDYSEDVYSLIQTAIRRYESKVVTCAAFPTLEDQMKWAEAVWKNANTSFNEPYKLTSRINSLIKGSSSNARGELKIAVRKLIPHVYGLTTDGKAKAIAKNKKRVAQLLAGHAYMYKDSVGLTGYAEAPIISLVLRATWFKNARDRGNEFSNYFNPITAVTLALIFTMVRYCLEEWVNGVEIEGAPFTEAGYKQQYDARLSDIEDWTRENPEFFKNLGRKLYTRAR
ncbi:hypothetical protein OF83DRAFT_1071594, partial [Amylostereum chailletii]